MTARDRAAMALHQTYGQRAGAQIAQLQSGGQPRVPIPPAAQTANYIKQEDGSSAFDGVQDYSQELKLHGQPVNSGQTDGTGDTTDSWEVEYARRKAMNVAHGAKGDHLVRAQFQARQQELEGGGLLVALDERLFPSKSTTRKVNALANSETTSATQQTRDLGRAQGDAAGDDDDEEDEDAINSDLDDPDDLAAAEENGENTDQVMLCTYDKVQRVKNKWKCTLKDGILRVDGNE
jgi:transcription initiation factor TFIIA large subunit